MLAKHPQEYELFTDVNDAIDRSITRINVPGFHLVEHMLLRPRKKIGQNGAEGSASENCFLPVQPDWNSQLDLSAFEEEDFPPEEATER